MEYLNASLGSAESPIGGTTSTALLSKTSAWSTEEPPFEWIGDYRAHQVFANMYFKGIAVGVSPIQRPS